MTATEVSDKLQSAYATLLDKDAILLDIDANERSITHKLAEYLQLEFPDWNVDCEYNRAGDVPKRVYEMKTTIESDDTNGTTVYPDIIIHRRYSDNNLVVIEAKKARYTGADNDAEKLMAYKNELGYEYAYKVIIGGDNAIQEVST